MIANILVTLYVGGLVDDGGKLPVLRSGTIFTAGAWLVRILATGGLGVFLVDSFYRVAKNMVGVPLTALLYDDGRGGTATEAVVFFEMVLSLGKILAALLAIAVFRLFPDFWPGIFILAAVFTLLYSAMRERLKQPIA
jgi:hypothetical protein